MLLLTTIVFGALIQLAPSHPADNEAAYRELSDDDRLEAALKSLERRTNDDDQFESYESKRELGYRELPDDDRLEESEESLETRANDDAQLESSESKRDLSSCPAGFTKTSMGYCYKLIRTKLAWNAAGMLCNSFDRRAHLAIIDSNAKQHDVQAIIDNVDSCKQSYGLSFWIGGQRIEPWWKSPFVWRALNDDGQEVFIRSMSYTNWHSGEPNYAKPEESCLTMGDFSYSWNDERCDFTLCSICEAYRA